MKLPLNLIIFATTIPKYGHGNNSEGYTAEYTYEKVIDSLFSNIDRNIFSNKLLHLKSRDGEAKIAEDIKKLCSKHEIRVIETKADVQHHSENPLNHASEYFKDIYKAFSDISLRKEKYSLWLEDDYIFECKDTNLLQAFKESIDFLDENPDQLCVRFNHSDGRGFGEPEGEYLIENDNIFTQAINYTKYGPTFTFQPNISRTNEIFIAWKTAQQYLDKLKSYHCELMSGELLRGMTNSKTPFSFYNTNKVYSDHIG
tara:strand:- start:472 stop:1242 length:771 start_codon:yes stop_codon:yes gene_type:complete